jgi:hypothetical protein
MSRSPYHVLGLKTVLSMPEPPMLIESILPRQGITVLGAKPGLGKTFLCLEMARAVATGGNFLGQFKAKIGAVLLVGQDQSILEYARQTRKVIGAEYEAQQQEYPDEPTDFEDRIFFITPSGANDRRVWIDDREDTADLIRAANLITHSDSGEPYVEYQYNPTTQEFDAVEHDSGIRGVSLIIIDTLSASHGSDENSNTEMNEVMRNVRKIAEQTRAAVVLTHHLTKGSGELRGAGAQEGALDNYIKLIGKPGNSTIKFTIPKFRGIRHPDFSYTMSTDEQSAVLKFEGGSKSPAELQSRLLEFLREAPKPLTLPELTTELQVFYPDMDEKKLYSRISQAISQLKKPSNRRVYSPKRGEWAIVESETDAATIHKRTGTEA